MKPIELGCPGHFISAKDCLWRRHTQVGKYRISSVGDLYYGGAGERQTIGATGYFETMVFMTTGRKCKDNEGCGCCEVLSWQELECIRYDIAGKAQAGHERLVRKYLRKAQA